MTPEIDRPPNRLLPPLIIIGALSFVVATALGIFGDDLRTLESAGADSFSSSAVGHRAFVEALKRLGYDVERGRVRSGAKAGDGLLVLAEPNLTGVASGEAGENPTGTSAAIDGAKNVLLTLPKWNTEPTQDRRRVKKAKLRPANDANSVLREFSIELAVYRPSSVESWQLADGEAVDIELDSPQLISPGTANAAVPIVESERGILLAEVQSDRHTMANTRLFILSDPDIIANHTLNSENDHAWLMTRFLDEHGFAERPVVFDEVLHGFGYQQSFWRQLFAYPFVFVTVQLIVTGLIVSWASLGRFGLPRRRVVGHSAGWRPLIENTADLVRFGGFYGHTIERYFRATVAEVHSRLVPRHLEGEAADRWLCDLSHRKTPDVDLDALRDEVSAFEGKRPREHATVQLARRIHRWKQEMLNASR